MLKTQPEPLCHLLWAAPRFGPHLVWSLHLGLCECGSGRWSDTVQGLFLDLPVLLLLMYFMADFMLLAECTWPFTGKADGLAQCLII